ncbi:preprotein translocase subunit YajC [Algiphilus aromaticivorans]|uniref:preprotein translocase subunit YajC n=1 Tax=Algiphilus aromaticivorans TaxID=382454 RepID=UPI000693213A
MSFLPLILLVVVFYFLLIRPQMKRNKEHRNMIASLSKGDEVITGGGLAGRINELGEHFVSVEIAENVIIKVQKQSIASVLPKGSLTES